MQEKQRLLLITQELEPYTDPSSMTRILTDLLAKTQASGMELRVLMPRFGIINERRHRLHEVVRLSGMNIIVDEDDYPLIIKVASLPNSRLQVYFLDNDDFFKRKQQFENESGEPFEDNADRMIFFCKGALEIVKKFGWSPDIIHCHGWMTSLVPAYLKMAYKNEPIFKDSKVVYSHYKGAYPIPATDDFFRKASINNMQKKDLEPFRKEENIHLDAGAGHFSDGIIQLNEGSSFDDFANKPLLSHAEDDLSIMPDYVPFYHQILTGESVVASH